MGKTIRGSCMRTWIGKKYQIGNVCLFIENKGYFCQYMWMTSKMSGKNQNMAPTWKKLMKYVDLEEPTSFLDHVFLGCTQRECKPNETIFERFSKIFESRISAGATEAPAIHGKTAEKYTKGRLARRYRHQPPREFLLTLPCRPARANRSVVPRHGRTCSEMR